MPQFTVGLVGGGSETVNASSQQAAMDNVPGNNGQVVNGGHQANSLVGGVDSTPSNNPGGGSSTTSTVNGSQQNIELFNQQAEALKNSAAATAAQIAYQYAHMAQVDVPGLQLQKDQLAFQQAQEAALEAYRQSDLNLRTLAQTQSNAIATGQLNLATLTQQQQNALAVANLGLDTLKLVASLQADPFKQQQVINGLTAGGYSNAIAALMGFQNSGAHAILGSAADSTTLASLAARVVGTSPATDPQSALAASAAPAPAPTPTVATNNPALVAGQAAAQPAPGPAVAPLQAAPTTTQPAAQGAMPVAPNLVNPPVGTSSLLFNPPSGADGANNPQPQSSPNAAATTDQLQMQASQAALPAANKVVARNFLEQDPTTQQFDLSGLSANNGLSMDDNAAIIKQGLPSFTAPRGSIGTG